MVLCSYWQLFKYLINELSDFGYKYNHNFRKITKLPEDSSLFSYILTVESDLLAQIAANRSRWNRFAILQMACPFFFVIAPKPSFFVPSQFVSWSAQPSEPPREV